MFLYDNMIKIDRLLEIFSFFFFANPSTIYCCHFLFYCPPQSQYRTAIQTQRAQDENLGPDIRAMDPFLRHEGRNFNKFQFKHSALKNQPHGVACSWKAASAYAQTEIDARDSFLAELKAKKDAEAPPVTKNDA